MSLVHTAMGKCFQGDCLTIVPGRLIWLALILLYIVQHRRMTFGGKTAVFLCFILTCLEVLGVDYWVVLLIIISKTTRAPRSLGALFSLFSPSSQPALPLFYTFGALSSVNHSFNSKSRNHVSSHFV